MNTGPAVPWSVPFDALAATRRPNDEYISTTTFLPYLSLLMSRRKEVRASSTTLRRSSWVRRSSAWVSKPPTATIYIRVGTSALMHLPTTFSLVDNGFGPLPRLTFRPPEGSIDSNGRGNRAKIYALENERLSVRRMGELIQQHRRERSDLGETDARVGGAGDGVEIVDVQAG